MFLTLLARKIVDHARSLEYGRVEEAGIRPNASHLNILKDAE